MAIPVKLEAFEGPLDLLLHLIEKNKIDIYDIPIVEITEPGKEKVTYVLMNPEKATKVVVDHLVNGNPVVEYTVGAIKK